jgi:hypothetical protein
MLLKEIIDVYSEKRNKQIATSSAKAEGFIAEDAATCVYSKLAALKG